MRKLLALAFVAALYAQDINYPSTSASGSITAANAACTATSCVWIVTLQDNSAVSVQLTGTFTATVQFDTSVDVTKDQSYFLHRLTQKQLANVLFPLGEIPPERISYHVLEALDPATRIVEFAKDNEASLIIIGGSSK